VKKKAGMVSDDNIVSKAAIIFDTNPVEITNNAVTVCRENNFENIKSCDNINRWMIIAWIIAGILLLMLVVVLLRR
jgi:hypothetical protein